MRKKKMMSDDIVTQLREIKWHDAETWVDKMAQAADEIERLRKLVGQSFMQVIFDEVYKGDLETVNAEWDKLKEKRNG
jgi:hypothetical protein